jgi:hypothetical protein
MIGRRTLSVKDVNSAHPAKVMLRPPSVPFIERQPVLPLGDREAEASKRIDELKAKLGR